MSLKPKTVDFETTWDNLQETIRDVLTLSNIPRSVWNDRFTDVYSLCVAHPEPLADRLYLETRSFVERHVKFLLVDVQRYGEKKLLKSYYEAWSKYSLGCLYLHRLYLYLNQQHIRKQKLSEAEIIYGTPSAGLQEQMEIGELGLEMWKMYMINPLKDRLVKLLLDGIDKDRRGQSSTQAAEVIKGVIQSFVSVEEFKPKAKLARNQSLCTCATHSRRELRGRRESTTKLYEEIFEKQFLDASGEYYKREASRLMQTCDVSLYMEKVTQTLQEESLRSQKFLHSSSHTKLRNTCEQHMVEDHLSFLHSECQAMVQEERKRDLSLIYPLLRSVQNGMSVLVKEVLEHIKQQGLEVITGLRGDPMTIHTQFVENMLAVHKKYKDLIMEVFAGDQSFMGALDKACTQAINHRINQKALCRSPELLAKYCDSLLRKSAKGISDAEIDERLAQSITVFKYIDDKDIFQKFYARMLAKRLIHQQSQSMDAEEAMINRLKQACGYEFTNKLHRMFTDISVSSDFTTKFQTFLTSTYGGDLGFSFSMYVLQAGAWPLTQTTVPSFSVPKELEKAVQRFEVFYHKGFSGRKLTWLHHLSQGELKLTYLRKPYQVTMQTFQMAILLQYQEVDSLTYREIQECLQLFDESFNKHLLGLLDSKLLLPDANPPGPETVIRLNKQYTNKRTKFRITTIIHKETTQEVEQTMSSVDEDRKMYLQAAIVRIMKSRKVMKHNCLMQEVLTQSRSSFAPSVHLIKKCIEALIDKQYLERTPNSPDEYSYVA